MQTATTTQKTNIELLKKGDFLSEIEYYKVNATEKNRIEGVTEDSDSHWISNSIIENNAYSAHQYSKEVYVSREQMLYIFQQIGSGIFTVNFQKQMKDAEVNKAIKNSYAVINSTIEFMVKEYSAEDKPTALIKEILTKLKEQQKEGLSQIQKAVEGENRTLVGYKFTREWNTEADLQEFLKVEKNSGRFDVIDLEKPKEIKNGYDTRYCQVDGRTINWLIWQNCKIIYGNPPKDTVL